MYPNVLSRQTVPVSVTVLFLVVLDSFGSKMDDEIKLTRDLFADHDASIRPVINQSTRTVLNIMYYLQNIIELDERKQTLTTSGFLSVQWADETLTWNPEEYGGLTDILVHPNDIWIPDITILNGANNFIYARNFNFLVELKSTGRTDWSPASVFETVCPVDVALYPFDTQTCEIAFSSWMYNSKKVEMIAKGTPNTTLYFGGGGEWIFVDSKASYFVMVYNGGNFSIAKISLTFHRRRAFYVINVIVPLICLSILNTLVFLVPPESGEKMSLSITVVLAYSVFLSIISGNMPGTSNSVSFLAIYLIFVLVMGMVAVFMSAVVLRVFHKHGRQLDLHRELLQRSQIGSTDQYENNDMTKVETKAQYYDLITKIDNVSFCAFFGLTLTGLCVLMSLLLT